MSRRADVEACICKAAEILLRREGPAFSMNALARKAGVSRATLYRHVRGRRALTALVGAVERPPSARERLVVAATELIAARGLRDFLLDEVATAAGVSPTTLYREFRDRADLLRVVLETAAPADAIVTLLADHSRSPEQVLPPFVTELLGRLEEQPLFLRLLLLGDAADVIELRRLRRARASVSHTITAYLDAQVRAGRLRPLPSPHLVSSLIGLVLGSRVASRMNGGRALSREETATAIVDLYLHGAAAPGGPA